MIYFLLILYQIKHFVCDYPLQGKYMLGKFGKYPNYILPLLAHVGVHGVATFLIALAIKPKIAIYLALFDMVCHFTMDRIKASPDLLGQYKALDHNCYVGVAQMAEGIMPVSLTKEETEAKKEWALDRLKSNIYFWWSLGLDQGVHHLTHYFIIWRLVS